MAHSVPQQISEESIRRKKPAFLPKRMSNSVLEVLYFISILLCFVSDLEKLRDSLDLRYPRPILLLFIFYNQPKTSLVSGIVD